MCAERELFSQNQPSRPLVKLKIKAIYFQHPAALLLYQAIYAQADTGAMCAVSPILNL